MELKTVLNIIEYNEENTPLFSLPNRITTNLKDDILIIDTLSMSDLGKIICLDKVKGNVKWSYRGYPNVNDARGDNSSSPFDSAVTPVGNIVVADTINSALHFFLSEAGIILKCFSTLSMDIKLPCSLDIDRDDMLWKGSNGYEGQSEMPRFRFSNIAAVKMECTNSLVSMLPLIIFSFVFRHAIFF
ncbi:unnamed protein product [Mytilus edulis]|uniref:Uncharacterized protein n=1 Tax=Mytilus edulis TaxID=6550 RepID=A0A8S3VFM5_MYTED|nr:unnamed protein product [Mytilus edulis]